MIQPCILSHHCLGLALVAGLVTNPGVPSVRAASSAKKPWQTHGPVRAAADGHRLVHADGTPFIWLGDTAWALHQNLGREEILRYLNDARNCRFTLIQVMSANLWALKDGQNYYGDAPYIDGKPWNFNPAYWRRTAWS